MLTSGALATLALSWLSSFQSVTGAAVGELNQDVRGDPHVIDTVGRALREAGRIARLHEASPGVEASIYANVGDFYVEVKGGSERHCELAAQAEYTLAVGGAAGATLAVGNYLCCVLL